MLSPPLVLLLAASGVRLAGAARICPPLGPVLPIPRSPSTNPAVISAISAILADLQTETSVYNASAVSISIKSIHEDAPMLNYHYTPPQKDERGAQTVDEETIYRIASVSKTFTILAALQRSEINFDDPVTKYIPELRDAPVDELAFVDWEEVTVAALAAHLAGIGADMGTDGGPFPGDWESLGLPALSPEERPTCSGFFGTPPCTREDFMNAFRNRRPPVYPPYYTPVYSNAGTSLVGYVVEAVSGKPYFEALHETVLDPTGMTNTTMRPPENLEWLFIPEADTLGLWELEIGALEPAGGMFSNTIDMRRFGEAILKHKLLSAMKTRKWLKPVTFTAGWGGAVGEPWEIARSDNLTADGRIIDIYTKGGDLIYYHANLALVPDYDLVVTILVAGLEVSSKGWSYYDLKLTEIFRDLIPAVEKASIDDATRNFVGTYADEETNSTLTLSLDSGPGLVLTNWVIRGFEVLPNIGRYLFLTVNNTEMEPGNTTARIFPTGLETETETGWRAVFYDATNEQLDEIQSRLYFPDATCVTWLGIDRTTYNYYGIDEFDFTLEGETAVSVTPKIFNVTLGRVT